MNNNISFKKAAFEFSVLLLAAEFVQSEHSNVPDLNTFFLVNNFGINKLKLIPFFLCTANGNRPIMLETFDSFIATELGNEEQSISEVLDSGGENNFRFFWCFESGLLPKLDESPDVIEGKIDIKNLLKNLGDHHGLGDDDKTNLENFSLQIIHVIKILQKKTDNAFASYDDTVLSFYSKSHDSWFLNYHLQKHSSLNESDKFSKISEHQIISETSVFASYELAS